MTQADHAKLMDDIYRYQRFIYNLTRKYYLFGRDRLIRDLDLAPGASLVEVGCGTARNLIRIAKRYPTLRLYGLDVSSAMLRTAAAAVKRAGLEDRIHLAQGLAEDLTAQTFAKTEPFDCVVFSYSLSMIPDWRGALNAAAGVLAPSGSLRIVDFADLKGLGRVGRWALTAWLRLFHVAPREELLYALENGNVGHMVMLPARYAFLLVIGKQNFASSEISCCKRVTEG
jgi:S-adenosylmethionine-diacylgycerolhomoserine-N-methlytransferase